MGNKLLSVNSLRRNSYLYKKIALLVIVPTICTGCAGKIHQEIPACELSEAAAEEILARATAVAAPAAETSRAAMGGGVIRYQITMRIAFDEHIISATATPSAANNSYIFTVSDFGSLFIRGPETAIKTIDEIKRKIFNRCSDN